MTVPSFVPTLQLTGKSTAITFHFRRVPPGYGEWALASVNDRTGELLIMSDWGNWSHRWNIEALGEPSLMVFLASRGSSDYVSDKLTGRRGSDKPLREEFDVDATVREFRRMICERRLEEGRASNDGRSLTRRHLTASIARDLYNDLGHVVDIRDADHFMAEKIYEDSDYNLVGDDLFECVQYKPTTSYLVLRHGIVPAVIEACRSELAQRAEGRV
jgi:hypothetical protein